VQLSTAALAATPDWIRSPESLIELASRQRKAKTLDSRLKTCGNDGLRPCGRDGGETVGVTAVATTAGVATECRSTNRENRERINQQVAQAKRSPGLSPRSSWPRAPPRLPDGERLSWPTLQKQTASIKERGGLNTNPCVPVLRATVLVTPAPCDCNTAESESDDREESRLNL